LRAQSDGGMTSTRMATQATRAIRMGPSAVVTEEARRAAEGDLQAAVRHHEAAVAAMLQHLIRRRMTSATSARKSACKGAHSAETSTRAAAARPRRARRARRVVCRVRLRAPRARRHSAEPPHASGFLSVMRVAPPLTPARFLCGRLSLRVLSAVVARRCSYNCTHSSADVLVCGVLCAR